MLNRHIEQTLWDSIIVVDKERAEQKLKNSFIAKVMFVQTVYQTREVAWPGIFFGFLKFL